MRKKLLSMVAAIAVGFGAFAQTTSVSIPWNQYNSNLIDYQYKAADKVPATYQAAVGDIIKVHVAGTADYDITNFQVALIDDRAVVSYWSELAGFKPFAASVTKNTDFDFTVELVVKAAAVGAGSDYQKIVFDASSAEAADTAGKGGVGTSVKLTLTTYEVSIDKAVAGVTTITSNGTAGEYQTTYTDSVLNKIVNNEIDTVKKGDIVQVKISGKALTGIKQILSGLVNESSPSYWTMLSGYNQWNSATIEPGTSFSYVTLDTITTDMTNLLKADDSKGKFQNLLLLAKADSNVKIQDLVLRAQIVKPATSVQISGGTTITTANGTLQLSAAVNAEATDKSIVWTTSNAAATIDADGTLTAAANGSVKVIATVFDGSKVADTIEVTISGQANDFKGVTSITISGENDITTAGGTITLTATVNAAATDKVVIWRTEGTAATFNETTGVVTAVSNGTFKVTAVSNENTTITDVVTITITGQPILATKVVISGATSITANKGTLQLTATVTPSDATDKTVTWSVTAVPAGAATIDATTGVLTAAVNGWAYVVATSNDAAKVASAQYDVAISGQTGFGAADASFSFGPNPAVDVVTVATEEAISSITVANISGAVVLSDKSGAKSFSVAGLAKGTYVATIVLANGEEVVKTIVKK